MGDRDRHRGGLLGALAAIVAALCVPAVASGAEFRAGLGDDREPDGCALNGCTLREAVQAANANPGHDRIRLSARRDYRLEIEGDAEDEAATGDLDVTDSVTIAVGGSGRARIDAMGIDRALDLHADARLVGVELTGGRAPASELDGAALRATDARVEIRRSRLHANHGPASAAAVAGGTLFLRRTSIVRNSGTGLIAREAGAVSIADSKLSENTGAGVQAFGEDGLRIDGSELSDNLLAGVQEFGPGDLALVQVRAERNGGHAAEEEGEGGLFVRGSRLRYSGAPAAVESASGSVSVFNSRLARNGGSAVLELDEGGVTFKRVRAVHNQGLGIDEHAAGGIRLEFATIRGGEGGILERDDGGVELSISKVLGSDGDGVVARGPGVSIFTRAAIRGHDGLGLGLAADANALRTRVAANRGGIEMQGGRLVLARSTVARNDGELGGIALRGESALALKQSTISGNATEGDGGGVLVADQSEVEALNSTLAGNRADGDGGAIHLASDASLAANAVTIARNLADADGAGFEGGGGIALATGAGAELENSLIAANLAGDEGPDCAGSFASGGGNLVGDPEDCEGFDAATDLVGVHPWLGRLRSNGGPTATIALRPRSPAIGAAGESAPPRDQRGVRRSDPDSGAFERR